jgi:hypothetical protein
MNQFISTLILTVTLYGVLSANQNNESAPAPGCTISFQQVITNNPDGCSGSEDGSICVTINGTVSNEFELSIDNGASWTYGKSTICIEDRGSGSYYLQIKEQGGCTVIYPGNPVVLGVDNPITINEIATTPQTYSELGSITVIATGISPFQYRIDGGTWQSSEKFFDLNAGNYTVEVKDAVGCSTSQEAIVTDERCPEFTSTTTTEKNCFSPNGSITITTSIGIRPLTYSNDNGSTWQSDSVFSNLSGGIYQLAVKGDNGCISHNTTTVSTSFVQFSGSSSVLNIAGCMGDATGEIRASSFGGQTPKTYSIDNGENWQSSGTFTGLTAGSYTDIVMDAFGCTDTTIFTITQPIHDTIDFATVNNILDCAGDATGSIALDAALPIMPLGSGPEMGAYLQSYSIDGGLNWQENKTFEDLKAGEYTAVVKVDDCEYPYYLNPVIITEPDSVQFTSIAITPDYGNSSGEITITASGGNNMYEYSIDGGVTFVESNSFTALSFGSFDLAVSDGIGCTADSTVTVPDEAVKITNVETTDVTGCFGDESGTITVTATGGSGYRSYSIDGGVTWQSSNEFSGLAADSYSIRVKDEAENMDDWSSNPVTLAEPAEINFLHSTSNPDCNGTSTGEITFDIAVGGTGALSYSIDGGTSYSDVPTFTGLPAGSYNMQISDENNCIKSFSENPVVLTDPPLFEVDTVITIDNTSCVASGNGSIAIVAGSLKSLPLEYPPLKSANATVEHYYYSIDNGLTWHQDTTVFENLSGGLYQAWARNPAGCLAEYNSNPILLSTNNIEISSVRKTDITHCDSTNNGTITINAMGESALQYSIDNGSSWETNNVVTNLAPDSYTIVVKNSNNCEKTYARNPVRIVDYKMPVIFDINVHSPRCYEPNSGEIQIMDEGGEGGGTPTGGFSIDSGLTWQSNGYYDELAEGIYNAVIKDTNGCITSYESNPISIEIPDEIIITDVITTEASGETLGSIEIVATGGTEPLYYSIDDGDYYFEENLFTDLPQGSYTIIIQDDNMCELIYANNPILLGGVEEDVEITETDFESGDTLCFGAYQTITVGGDGSYVDFYSGSSTSLIAGTSITFMPGVTINSGSYLSATITTDSSFCEEVALGSPVVADPETDKSNDVVKPIDDNTNSLKGQSLIVFPNPNSGRFIVELTGFSETTELIIYNALGSIIYKESTIETQSSIEIGDMKRGLYFIKVFDASNSLTKKMIVR